MSQEEIRKNLFRLLKNIAPETNPENLLPDQDIRKALGIDSFDYLNFIIGIDETFGIETSEEDYGKIRTMKDLVNYLKTRPVPH